MAVSCHGSSSSCFATQVAYPTVWGQHVIILGEGPLLSKGYRLACHHVGDELVRAHCLPANHLSLTHNRQVWQTIISVGYREPLVYKYAIVDDDDTVLLSETCTRRVVFPTRLAEDSVVKVCDVWQVCGSRTPSGNGVRIA